MALGHIGNAALECEIGFYKKEGDFVMIREICKLPALLLFFLLLFFDFTGAAVSRSQREKYL
jgi:hypothetical protein